MTEYELEQLLQPTVEALGCILWGCHFFPERRHALLRIYIDKIGGTVGIDDCERVSRQVTALLDVEDPIPGQYTLEVSSPGLDRLLFREWHFEHFLGHNVQLKLVTPIEGRRKLKGNIASVDDDSFVLDEGGESRAILFSNVAKANLTVE